MKNILLLQSNDSLSTIKVDKGELVSYQKNNVEYIHQKGNPGWRNSDTEMFPIIGPTKKNNFKVVTKKGVNHVDQHGFLRELPYVLISSDKKKLVFKKEYLKNTKIKNSKYPTKSTQKELSWLYSFTFYKTISITNSSIEITFKIITTENMPFMLGYHPAFFLSGNGNETFKIKNTSFTLQNIIDKKADAYPFYNTNKITLFLQSGKKLILKTKGFNNVMLWTEVKNMVCIEPITQYPDLEKQQYSEKNMQICNNTKEFSVKISIL